MYCARCGVELGEGESKCPLCGLRAYHPELPENKGEGLYPTGFAPIKLKKGYLRLIFTISAVIAAFTCVLIDFLLSGGIGWSGIVLSGLATAYILFILPLWFKRINWIAFLSADTVAVELLLLYLNLYCHGHWFLSYAFPITAFYGVLVVTAVALFGYLKKGTFYILGGLCLALAGSMMLVEFLGFITFHTRMFVWSLYPTAVLGVLGIFWLLAGIIKPLGNWIRKKMFV